MKDELPEVIFDPQRMVPGIVTTDDEMATVRWVNLRRPSVPVAIEEADVAQMPADALRARLDDEYYLDADALLYRFLENQ